MRIALWKAEGAAWDGVSLAAHLAGVGEVICGGEADADMMVLAEALGVKLTPFFPLPGIYGDRAPLFRDLEMIDCADAVILLSGKDTAALQPLIAYMEKNGKPYRVIIS